MQYEFGNVGQSPSYYLLFSSSLSFQWSHGHGVHRGQPPRHRAGWRRGVSSSGGADRDMLAQPLVEYIRFMKDGTLFVLLIATPLPRTVPVG